MKTKFCPVFSIFFSLLFPIILTCLFFATSFIACRSSLRSSQEKKPRLEVSREKIIIEKIARISKRKKIKNIKPKIYFIASNQLEADPIFKTFDKKFFYSNMLPEKITYRYDKTKSVTKYELEKKLEVLIKEIHKKKRKYTDFIILKKRDFNKRNKSGLLILKFKDYPFVAKVFMENPKSFVMPYSKGLCPTCFFNMSGGMCRHLLGFTRIKNLYNIQKKISLDPKWSNLTVFPRKFYWVPKDSKNIKIVGKNFYKNSKKFENKEMTTIIPGTYLLIADEIKLRDSSALIQNKNSKKTCKNKCPLFDHKNIKSECMALCNFVNVKIDPNPENFLFEADTNKIAIIDTENFKKMVGLKGKQEFSSHFIWYCKMVKKYLCDTLLKPKKCATL